jgi:hypothetical protein
VVDEKSAGQIGMELIIELHNPEDALRNADSYSPSSASSSDLEDRVAPFTSSPLDSCRGGKQKTPSRVRDARKKNKKTTHHGK